MTFIDASLAAVLFGALVILGTLGAFHMSWFRKPHQPGEDGEIPIRVRQTLDTIVGGVVILDIQERILFANESFAACLGQTPEQLKGVVLASLPWRMDHHGEWPWQHVLRESQPQTAIKLHLRIHAANEMSFMVNATPLLDASNHLCSALVSFENITLIEDQRQELVRTLKALEVYQDQIRGQNEILHELANRDSLTGVYNRRALFAKVEARWEDRNEGDLGLITILMDVDHFKKLNDEFGHAVGDGVLKDVVVVLQDIVGSRGMVARYGGEEFCVVMERARVDEGVRMAERIRSAIHELLEHPYRVTASFGVSGSQLGAKSLQAQLQQSDQGLYAAKRAGRNAVRCWSVQLERETRDIERRAVERQNQTPIEDHPISYHAVVALCAAVAHRNPSLAAHCQRVAEMAAAVGRGLLSIDTLYVLEIAAMLHEVGMIGQYSEAMSGRDRSQWTSERLVKMQQRNRIGLEIIRSSMHSQPLIDMLQFQWQVYGKASEVGLQPEEIPLGARILAVVNTYDDMTSPERGTPMPHPAACERLRQMAGRELDPMIVERFIDLGVGWRHSGRIEKTSIDGRLAVILGYQMERLLHSYSERNAPLLKTRLQSLSQIAQAIDLPPMKHLVLELSNEVDRKAISDWQSLLPMVEDLLELGMMIQREFLRSDRVFCEA